MNSRLPVSRYPFSFFALALSAFLILTFLSRPAIGQQTLGSLNGTVTDVSGAVVQKATVRIRNLGTNLEVTAESKNDGSFSAARSPHRHLRRSLLPKMVSRPPSITRFWCRAIVRQRSTPGFSPVRLHPR